ncbi:MAG: transporter substrate-binding domain-containing protein [Phascolarctobacterium sp.]|nr:transporter substrate-binding domain-containing protein [Candidatus Phascolarctobacterium equi]
MRLGKMMTYAFCGALMAAVTITAANVDAAKKLKVGMECGYAPYNWSQPTADGGAVKIAGSDEYAYGYDVIMAKKLADSMGAELEVHKIEWDGLPPAVVSGKIDAAIAGMSITSERKQTVDFTKPYYYANIVALVKKAGPFANAKCVADLKGAKASSQINTVWYDKMIDQVPGVTKLPAIDTVPGLIVALQSGKINLFVTDAPTAQAAEFANKDLMMVEFPADKGFKADAEDIEIGIAVRKGNKALTDAMNKVLGVMTDKDFKAVMAEAIKKQPLAN